MADNGIRTSNLPLGDVIEVLGHEGVGDARKIVRTPITAFAAALRDIVSDDPSGVAGVQAQVTALSGALAEKADSTALALIMAEQATIRARQVVAVPSRPGDGREAFTASKVGGPAEALPIWGGPLAFGDNGFVYRVTGAGVLAQRGYFAIEPGRRYRARFVVQRRTNAVDPSNDTVRCAVLWFDQAWTAAGASPILDLNELTVANGRQEIVRVLSRAAGPGVDLVAPANARYGRLYVETFGGPQVTDVEVIKVDDVTDASVLDPVSAGALARLGAIESKNYDPRLAAVEAATQNPNSLTFATRNAAATATVPANVTTILTRGFLVPGIGGDEFRRVASQPEHTAFFRTADGSYFEKVSNENTPEQFGAIGNDDSVNNYVALAEWFIYGRVTLNALTMRGRRYNTTTDPIGVGGAKGPRVRIRAEAGARIRGPMILDTGIEVSDNPITVNLLQPGTPTNYLYDLSPSFYRPLVEKSLWLSGGDLDRSKLAVVDTASANMRSFTLAYPNADAMPAQNPFYAADAGLGLNSPGGSVFGFGAWPVRGATEMTAWIDAGTAARAIYIRTSTGYVIFRAAFDAIGGTLSRKVIGQAATETSISWNGPAFHLSYRPQNALWGVRNYDGRRFAILINGHEIYQGDAGGTILEMGYGALATASTNFVINDWTIRTETSEARGAPPLSFVIVGDSFSAPAHGGWPTHFREALYGALGVDVGPISNLAISGQNSGDQLAKLQATGIGTQTHGIIMIGANDQQQGVDLGLYKNNLRAMIQYFLDRGKRAHMVVQSLFYDQTLAPGGFQTSNYQNGAKYRAAALRIAIEKGISVTDLTQSLKGMFADALTDGSEDPGLADNIHPTVLSRRIMGREIARDVLAAVMPRMRRGLAAFPYPADIFLSGWAPGGPWPGTISLSDDGRVLLSGTVTVGTRAAGTKIMQLPRNLRPTAESLYTVIGSGNRAILLDIAPDGSVYLSTNLAPTSDTWIAFSTVYDAQ